MKVRAFSLTLASLVVLATFAAPASSAKPSIPPGKLKRDVTPPTLVLPANITAEATGPLGAWVWFAATATDNVDPAPTITYSRAPGSTFPIAMTTVTVTARDAKGNTTTGSFKVTVQDTTPPVLTLPGNITRPVAGPEVVTFAATATDIVDPAPTITYSPASGSTFPVGTTTVTVTAKDAKGNTATGTFQVTLDGDPTDGPFAGTYSWFTDTYEWTITVSPDGTISGLGQQTGMAVYDVYWDEYGGGYYYSYTAPLPDGFEASGAFDGYVTDAGDDLHVNGSYSEWWYDNYYGEYGFGSSGLYLAGSAALDESGNLVITDPYYGYSTIWYRQ